MILNYLSYFVGTLYYVAILLTQPDGTIVKANKAACKLFAYTEEELKQLGRQGIIDQSETIVEEKLKERKEMVLRLENLRE
jgi:PAS domain S-box-containing protein